MFERSDAADDSVSGHFGVSAGTGTAEAQAKTDLAADDMGIIWSNAALANAAS